MKQSIYSDGTYLADHPSWDLEHSPWKARQILKMISKHNIQFSSYVEIGCGAGGILQILASEYPEVKFHGYDISPQAIQMANKFERDNLTFFCGDILAKNDLRYDVAALIDVIEHVEDYISFLRSIRGLAEKFLFVFPLDITVTSVLRNILHGGNCGHLHYFLKDIVLERLRSTGFNVIDYFYMEAGLEHVTNMRRRIAYLPRKILYFLNQDLCARILGGFPLIILASSPLDASRRIVVSNP